jgi:hypothetical protein
MRKVLLITVVSITLLVCAQEAGAQHSGMRREILGIGVGMGADEARARLRQIGEFQKSERKGYEVWAVRDPYFSHLMIKFDKAGPVHSVTAVAREDQGRRRMRYTDVSDVARARQAGEPARSNFRYEWILPAKGKAPKVNVVAWGRHRKYLQYYSIERMN